MGDMHRIVDGNTKCQTQIYRKDIVHSQAPIVAYSSHVNDNEYHNYNCKKCHSYIECDE